MTNYKGLSLDWSNLISIRPSEDIKSEEHPGFKIFLKPTVKTVADSAYTGEWNALGFAGYGTFAFPNGVIYKGHFKDSMFHGSGSLTYPMGQMIFEGRWYNGRLQEGKFRFADGAEYGENWGYCRFPDRRFFVEIKNGLRSICDPILTNRQPTRKIPIGFYDIENGLYNSHTKCVISALNRNKIIRIPTAIEEKWITDHCRRGWEEPTGYRPDLYEVWTTGRASSAHALIDYYKRQKEIDKRKQEEISAENTSSASSSVPHETPTEETVGDLFGTPDSYFKNVQVFAGGEEFEEE